MDSSGKVLIVEDDSDLSDLLATTARARGYRPVVASTLTRAIEAVERCLPDVAVVNVALGGESGLELLPRIKELTPDSEIVVVSGATSLAGTFTSCDMPAFAFVEKPFDIDRLFATVERALERRRLNLQNRRLVWELQTINEIADGISRSLELEDVLTGALQRLVPALEAAGGSIRLLDELTGQVRAAGYRRSGVDVLGLDRLRRGPASSQRTGHRHAQAGRDRGHCGVSPDRGGGQASGAELCELADVRG